MAIVITESDIILSITRANELLPLVGADSKFIDEVHPGTGKKIEGWKWDQRTWPTSLEFQAQEVVPAIWNPDNSILSDADFQSGVGDNQDLKVHSVEKRLLGTREPWAPVVEHGYYYEAETEGYLFSDSSISQMFANAVNAGGSNYLNLSMAPKAGTPIRATKYKWDATKGKWEDYIKFTKKASFSGEKDVNGVRAATRDNAGAIIYGNIDTTLYEFVVESDVTPQQAILNGNHITQHGGAGPNDEASMEVVGVAAGTDLEEFNTLYSPIITAGIEVVSYYTDAGPFKSWSVVSAFTGVGDECIVDKDLGIVKFNESPATHPAANETIAIRYKSSVWLEYEPDLTTNTTDATEVNVNPLGKTSPSGFIYLKQALIEPYSILLEAESSLISEAFFGPTYLGSPTKIKATVKSKSGDAVEGAEVTFSTLNSVGQFSGGNTSIKSLTDFNGVARTTFSAPRNIRTLGAVTSSVSQNGGKTLMVIDSTSLVGNPAEWYVYKVFNDDPSLGIADPKQYYIDYLAAEGITGPTAAIAAGATDYDLSWEHTHRIITGLMVPTKYDANLRNGKKQLVVKWDATAINPHNNPWDATLGTGAFVPIRPESAVVSGTQTTVTLDGLHDLPGGTLAGYFIVGPTVASLRASVYNERLRTTIQSNKISLEVRVPPSMDGTVLVSALNEVQKQALLGVGVLDAPTTGVLPLGFRVKGLGVNLAACLDGLTYFDVNKTLHDTSDATKTGTNVIGHAFTVR